MPRRGASTEIAIEIGAGTHDVLGRLTAGFAALATAGADHSMIARFVVAPTFFTIGPP